MSSLVFHYSTLNVLFSSRKMEGVSDGIGKGLNIDTKTHVFVFICQPLVADLNELHNARRINMPTFGSPFSGLANNKKLTNDELIRAVRFTVAAEFEATQLYMQLAASTDNKLAVKVLKAVADEERVHVGEFLRLLHEGLPPMKKSSIPRGQKRWKI